MNKPTDAELKALWQIHAADIGGIFHYARAVLAKWGQPAQAAEPVAWLNPWRADQVTTDYDAYGRRGIPLVRQQPTHAQAGAMPLDEARRLFDAGWKAAALFCDREDVVADGVIGFGACPQFEAVFSAAHGIKGGQHG